MEKDPIMDMYIFESKQLTEQLEGILLESEGESNISEENVSEIFRIMHTLKGSSAMMMYSDISNLAHKIEDLFFYIREGGRDDVDFIIVIDLALEALDFIRGEVDKIESGDEDSLEAGEEVLEKIESYLSELKGGDLRDSQEAKPELDKEDDCDSADRLKDEQVLSLDQDEIDYCAKVRFQKGCQMENIRAFTVLGNIKPISTKLYHEPDELLDNGEEASKLIAEKGFLIYFSSKLGYEEVKELLDSAMFAESTELDILEKENMEKKEEQLTPRHNPENRSYKKSPKQQKKSSGMINVDIEKLDKLLDLVGEIVTTESMVMNHPDITSLGDESLDKSKRQLKKLTDELQDIAMSLRMVPIGPVFQKMNRIVRDMCKKVEKEVDFITSGEDTEVDKNIIDSLADPFMHLIRNSMDHGIEKPEDRESAGKSRRGKVCLEASNTGGDIVINLSDDGKGLDREVLISKAREKGLIDKNSEDISDAEAYSLILEPGFSTKKDVTEFSGRGVGMDVVRKNIEKIGGKISIDSSPGKGTSIMIRIPLTLAIVDGMQLSAGNSRCILPISSIRESFRPKDEDIVRDTNGKEMIMIRGECYPVLKLYEHFSIEPKIRDLTEGILVLVESASKKMCIFADELLGEQQVVVKPIPKYLSKYRLKELGIGGCNILGDGSVSLIVNVEELLGGYL